MERLNDVALHEIFVRCDFESIEALQLTNWRFREYIRMNRACFSKEKCEEVRIVKHLRDDCPCPIVSVVTTDGSSRSLQITGSLSDTIAKFNPEWFYCYDHEELANMSQLWWNDRKVIDLYDVADIRRYSRYFNRCVDITIKSNSSISLKDVLEHMDSKNLKRLYIDSKEHINCTEEDFTKIARISRKMKSLFFKNISRESPITYETILELIKNCSFDEKAQVYIPMLPSLQAHAAHDFEEKIKTTSCITSYRSFNPEHPLRPNDRIHCFKLKNDTRLDLYLFDENT